MISHLHKGPSIFNKMCQQFISRVPLPRQTENLLDLCPWKTAEITSWCPAHLQKLLSALKEVFIRDLNAFLDVLVVKPPNTFFRLPARVTYWEEKKVFILLFEKSIRSGSHPSNLSTNISQSLIMILILVFVFFPGVEYPLIGRCGFTLAYYVSSFNLLSLFLWTGTRVRKKIFFFLVYF